MRLVCVCVSACAVSMHACVRDHALLQHFGSKLQGSDLQDFKAPTWQFLRLGLWQG